MTIKTKLALVYTALIIILMLAAISARATTYYFSNSTGNDSRTSTQAQNTSTPWKSMEKLNDWLSSGAQPGDQLLLKRGDTWHETIQINRSGSSTAPIVIGAYGEGVQPIINGFSTMSGWVNLGGGIWESAANSEMQNNRLVMVVMTPTGGVTKQYAMGRTPNEAPRKWDLNTGGGWLKYTTRSTQPTGMALRWIKEANTSALNWTGAEVVIRTARWLIGWWPIVNHSGGTIYYYYDRTNSKEDFGYFFQNDPRTLDVLGEWYYNKSNKKLRVFFGSASPSSYVVEAASLDNLLKSTDKNYITIDNITFRGANGHQIVLDGGTGVVIKNCNIQFAGIDNLRTDDMKDVVIDNNVATDACNNNMWVHGTSSIIKNNSVRNSYVFPGMGGVGDGHGYGIRASGGATIEYNRIVNAGYAGIVHGWNYSVTRYNFIDSIALTKDDCGGIYAGATAKSEQNVRYTGIKTYNNIILHAIGNSDGTNSSSRKSSAFPIYQDDNMNGNEIYNNFFAFGNAYGMYLHNNSHQHVHHNIFYGNMEGGATIKDDGLNERGRNTTALDFHDNYYIQKNKTTNTGAAEAGMELVHEYSNVMGFGNWYNQVYARPASTNVAVKTQKEYPCPCNDNSYTLAQWKALPGGKDAGSIEAWANLDESSIIYFYNDTKVDNKVFTLPSGNYITARGAARSGSIELDAFQSEVLIKTSGGGGGGNNAPTVSITSPSNGVNYTSPATIPLAASAADNDGTVTSVKFYNGNTLLNTDATSPYSYNWTGVANGTYTITAVATDDDLEPTTSAAITVSVTTPTNTPPTVSISAPANNATYTAPATIVINATAADVNGTVSNVKFYQGDSLLSTDNSSPYTFTWNNVPVGSYQITAKATDNNAAVTESSIINVTVTSAGNQAPTVSIAIPTGTTYTSPATITIDATAADADGTIIKVDFYNGSTFLNSESVLPFSWDWVGVTPGTYSITAKAYDNNTGVTTSNTIVVTVNTAIGSPTVAITSPANNATFAVPAIISFDALASSPNGEIDKVEFYHSGTTLFQTENNPPWQFNRGFAVGTYIITAKATDITGAFTTSAPITFVVTGNNIAPTVALTSPSENIIYTNPANIILSATASDQDGSIVNVKFYNDATLLNTDATSPYSFDWNDVPIGIYAITARATDDDGSVTISGTANITVANQPPEDSITSPLNGAFFYTPSNIVINVGAEDENGTIAKVDFYNGSTIIGTDDTAPYSFTWNNVTTGDYEISAVAYDNDGGTAQATIQISVGTQAPATLSITTIDKNFVYDGTAKSVTVVTSPADLTGVTITYDGGSAPTDAGIYPILVTLTHDDFIAESITDTLVISKATPIVTWNLPDAITYPTALSGTQLNAAANVAGTKTYTPASGAVLGAGNRTLTVDFDPDSDNYNSVIGTSVTLVVNKATATIQIENLNQSADGNPKPVTVSTTPNGLAVTTTYNGSSTAPSAAGSYNVIVALVTNTNYQADNATGTLVISSSGQAISISNLSQIYDGTPKPVTITTEAESFTVTYNGSATVPTAAGTYTVVATITSGGGGSDTETLIVNKGNPTTEWAVPSPITFGTALSGAQLNVTSSVPGSTVYTPASGVLNAGPQVLSAVFSPTDMDNYNIVSGLTTTLVVNKLATVLTLSNLLQLYDGTAKSVTVTSVPEVLSGIVVTYNGSTTRPRNVGDYTVIALVTNANYQATPVTSVLSIVPIGVPGEVYNYIILNRTTIVNQ